MVPLKLVRADSWLTKDFFKKCSRVPKSLEIPLFSGLNKLWYIVYAFVMWMPRIRRCPGDSCLRRYRSWPSFDRQNGSTGFWDFLYEKCNEILYDNIIIFRLMKTDQELPTFLFDVGIIYHQETNFKSLTLYLGKKSYFFVFLIRLLLGFHHELIGRSMLVFEFLKRDLV